MFYSYFWQGRVFTFLSTLQKKKRHLSPDMIKKEQFIIRNDMVVHRQVFILYSKMMYKKKKGRVQRGKIDPGRSLNMHAYNAEPEMSYCIEHEAFDFFEADEVVIEPSSQAC